jgi:hypothetical protein
MTDRPSTNPVSFWSGVGKGDRLKPPLQRGQSSPFHN